MKKTLQILVCIVATLCCSSVVVAQSASEYDRLAREAYKNGDYAQAKKMCNFYCIAGLIDGNHPLEAKIDKCLEYKNEIEKAQAQDNHIDAYHFSKKIAEINADDKVTKKIIEDIKINFPEFVAEYKPQSSVDREYNHLGELNYKAKKYSSAVSWFLKASEMGNSDAQCNLGIYYINIDNNRLEAEGYFRKSAAQNNPKAIYYLGVYEAKYSQNMDKAINYFNKAHKLGSPDATSILGSLYYDGQKIEQNKPKGIELWKSAANAGSASAQYFLGVLYYEGKDVEKNERKGIELLKSAAAQEYNDAQIYLRCLGIK